MCVKYLAEYIRIMSERKFVVPLLSERKFNEINTSDYVKINGEDGFAKLFSSRDNLAFFIRSILRG